MNRGTWCLSVIFALLMLGFILALAAGCQHTKTTPMPGNGIPDGSVYGQTGEQCRAQPSSPWCAPR